MGLTQILEHLYIGSLEDVLNDNELALRNIVAILTVDSRPLPNILTQKFLCKQISLHDMTSEDLLCHVEPACELLDCSRSANQPIVIHW